MSRFTKVVLASAVLGALAVPAQAAQRAFVASFGSDANTATQCLFSAPCRGFAAAHSVVDPGGEIIALDTAGYGAVTITKSVSLIGNPGYYAGIAASTGAAVTIATPGVSVILRGLNLNGIGAGNGVLMTDGTALTIENCVVSNFGAAGVEVSTAARVRIIDTVIRGNGASSSADGIHVQNGAVATLSRVRMSQNSRGGVTSEDGTAGGTMVAVSDSDASDNLVGMVAVAANGMPAMLSVTRSSASNNFAGIYNVSATAITSVSYSMATGNSVAGLYQAAGTFRSQGNNHVQDNATNVIGVLTPAGGT